jgi:hypothetical protein
MAKKSLFERVAEAYPDFVIMVESMPTQELRERLASMAILLAETAATEEADQDLAAAKESVKTLSANYVEVKKAVKLKTRWIARLLEERGKGGKS